MYSITMSKQDLKWLQSALVKKDMREWSKQILVKNGKAYATNGHVMHVIDTIEDQDGIYNYDGIKIEDNGAHPLRNGDTKLTENVNRQCELTIIPNKLNTFKLNANIGIYAQFFYNAVKVNSECEIYTCSEGLKILVKQGNRYALIMGCKL